MAVTAAVADRTSVVVAVLVEMLVETAEHLLEMVPHQEWTEARPEAAVAAAADHTAQVQYVLVHQVEMVRMGL
jgi:hypothetical protein